MKNFYASFLLVIFMSVISCQIRSLKLQYCEKCNSALGRDFFEVHTVGNLNGFLMSDWSPKSRVEQKNVGGIIEMIFYDAKLNDSQKFKLEFDTKSLTYSVYKWQLENGWKSLKLDESQSKIFYFKDETSRYLIHGYLVSPSFDVIRTITFSIGENVDGFLFKEYK